MNNLKKIKDSKLISLYGKIVKELKSRAIIRTNNVVGDLGERFAIDYYTRSPHLDNLNAASPGTKSIDAIGEDGNRYAIKSTSGNVTGVFYGLPPEGSKEQPKKLFDYLLIVIFSDSYEVKAIYELTWEQFLKHKTWHSGVDAWHVPVNKKVKTESKTVYENIT